MSGQRAGGSEGPWACRADAGKAPQGCGGPGQEDSRPGGGRGLSGEEGGPGSGWPKLLSDTHPVCCQQPRWGQCH